MKVFDDAEQPTLQEMKATKAEWLRQEREIVAYALDAFEANDFDKFLRGCQYIAFNTIDGWRQLFLKVRRLPPPSPELQQAFFHTWIESKSIANRADDDFLTIAALRVLLPLYRGPAMKLYRGEISRKHRYRNYGISWTSDIDVARKFATDTHQAAPGGSLIVETVAPPEAIIGHYARQRRPLRRAGILR